MATNPRPLQEELPRSRKLHDGAREILPRRQHPSRRDRGKAARVATSPRTRGNSRIPEGRKGGGYAAARSLRSCASARSTSSSGDSVGPGGGCSSRHSSYFRSNGPKCSPLQGGLHRGRAWGSDRDGHGDLGRLQSERIGSQFEGCTQGRTFVQLFFFFEYAFSGYAPWEAAAQTAAFGQAVSSVGNYWEELGELQGLYADLSSEEVQLCQALKSTSQEIAEAKLQILRLQQQLQSHQLAVAPGEVWEDGNLVDSSKGVEIVDADEIPSFSIPQLLEDDLGSLSEERPGGGEHGMEVDPQRLKAERSRSPKSATPRKARKSSVQASPSQASEMKKPF